MTRCAQNGCRRPRRVGRRTCAQCASYQTQYNTRLRDVVLAHYGAACVCCGETQREFLTLDHVNNDGELERKRGLYSGALYRHIIREGFPDTYRVLCMNCNFARGKSPDKRCPHEVRLTEVV